MDRARSRRLLLLAFAISLLLHFAGMPFLKWPSVTRDEVEQKSSKVRVIRVVRAVRTPPPTPPPTPAPTPRHVRIAQHPVTRPLTVPRTQSTSGRTALPVAVAGPAVATGVPAATPPPPTPVPSATPCAGRTIAPQVLQAPTPPPIPSDARRAATEGVAAVEVNVDSSGRVSATSVRGSTGNPGLDAIAENMARGATYAPATEDCKKAAGVATFTVQFWVI